MEQEEVVNQQLSQLIRDAVWLKSYLASVMRLSQEAFSMSQAALGPQQTAPPPVCTASCLCGGRLAVAYCSADPLRGLGQSCASL